MSDTRDLFVTVELDASMKILASAFHCGNIYIDSFLNSTSALDPGFGKTYVWLEQDKEDIIGFYNITTGSIDLKSEEGYRKMGGSVHINEFALNTSYQRYKVDESLYVSDILLQDCIDRIKAIRNEIGFTFITLRSTEEGRNLYARNDFLEFEEDMNMTYVEEEKSCIPMYLPLDIEGDNES